ncbi:MAG: DNA repair protein RecO, partial [Rectinema sp.]|nr:DNA repair protein RecO [Rectinema sp.]
MAERNERYRGIFLHARDTTRGDRVVTFLAEEGLFSLFLFGGPRSSLKSAAMPYHCADVEIYHDRRTEFLKLTGVEIVDTFDAIHGSFGQLQAAAGAAEFIIRTSAFGGDSAHAYRMMLSFLRELEDMSESLAPLALDVFLWDSLEPLGIAPDTSSCEQCGRPLSAAAALPVAYVRGDRGFLCAACGENRLRRVYPAGALFRLDRQALECMRRLKAFHFSDAAGQLDSNQAKDTLSTIIELLA